MGIVLVAVAVALLGLFVAWRVSSAKSLPALGTAAPEFSLSSQDGNQVSLKEFRGKWVVLYFYPKDFTAGCTVEAHNFQRDQGEYARRNAVILGVSLDSAESHKNFCAKEGLNFKLLADTQHQVSKQYGSLMNFGVAQISARNTFLIDPQGNIARAFSSVNPSRHSAEMLSAIDELEKQTPVQ
jgi:peroxiredoxin Q/BCP